MTPGLSRQVSARLRSGEAGSGRSRAASRMDPKSSGEADGEKCGPCAASSTLMQTIACSESSTRFSSPHSVEPIRAYSSASHAARTIVRRGFQPSAASRPSARPSESSAAVPDDGSVAP